MPCRISAFVVVALLAGAVHGASPSTAPAPAEQARSLAKKAVSFLAEGNAAQAETVLTEASELDPRNPIYFYNLACARARQDKGEQAVHDLERAIGLGFTDFALIGRDADLAGLRELPRFQRLIENKDKFLLHTAEGTLAALRRRFGDEGYLYEVDPQHRLVFAVAMDRTALDDLKLALHDQADALHAALFEHGLDAYVAVVLPTEKDYGKMVRFRNVPGIYVDSTKSLIARQPGPVLFHEFTHALHGADRAPLGQEHAPWINEGLGAMCEAADFYGGQFVPRDNPRFAPMIGAARRKGLIPLERLVAMTQDEFVRRPNLTYGQSAYLMLYLSEKQLLKKFYDEYKSTYAKDATGRAALEAVTKKSLPDLQEDWRMWLGSREQTR
jgi:hypothetical protein